MSLVESEEMCETHFFEPVLKRTCSICMGRSRGKYSLGEERIIIPTERSPKKQMYMWTPTEQSLDRIPPDRDFVHISTSFSCRMFDELTEHLPQLVLVEVVPSCAHIVEANLLWFSSFHIGISSCRRYRQR